MPRLALFCRAIWAFKGPVIWACSCVVVMAVAWRISQTPARSLVLVASEATVSDLTIIPTLDNVHRVKSVKLSPSTELQPCAGCCTWDSVNGLTIQPSAELAKLRLEPVERDCDFALRQGSETKPLGASFRFVSASGVACPYIAQWTLRGANPQAACEGKISPVPAGTWLNAQVGDANEPFVFFSKRIRGSRIEVLMQKGAQIQLSEAQRCEAAEGDTLILAGADLALLRAAATLDGLALRILAEGNWRIDGPGCAYDSREERVRAFLIYCWGGFTSFLAFVLSAKALWPRRRKECCDRSSD